MKKFFILVLLVLACAFSAVTVACDKDTGEAIVANAPLRAEPVAIAPPIGEEYIDEETQESEKSLGVKVIDSYSDGVSNYYIIGVGHIKNTHLATTQLLYYNGTTPITSTTVEVTETSISNKLAQVASESTSFATTTSESDNLDVSVGANLEWEIGIFLQTKSSFKLTLDLNFEWSSSQTSESSQSQSVETAVEKIQSTAKEQSLSFTVGGNGERAGWYRYGLYAITDLYYVINTSRDNQELLGWSTTTCVRTNSILPYLEYSEDGSFNNAPNINDVILIADEFWTKLKQPTKSLVDTYASKLSAGNLHSLWIDAAGQLWAFGDNSYGQLGNGESGWGRYKTAPVQVKAGQNKDVTKFRAVSAGGNHCLAIDADGNLWAWGHNGYGQVGNNSTTTQSTPVNILPKKQIVAIAAGYDFSMAIDYEGKLWTWGYNSKGQLGIGSFDSSKIPVQVFAGENEEVSTFRFIAAGATHGFAIDTENNLWGFGNNANGQLGYILEELGGNLTNYSKPMQIVMPNGLSPAVAKFRSVSGGTNHSLLIDINGTLWACGQNTSGQLGNGSNLNPSSHYHKLDKIDGQSVIFSSASAGCFHSYAIDINGVIWSFGSNAQGQLGHGVNDTSSSYSPKEIFRSDIQFAAVSAGTNFGLAIDVEGDIWSWGENVNGQLGIGTTANRTYTWPIFN